MGNEMGNRNVSGLQEEEKAVGEETEKILVGVDCEDEIKAENHVVPDVKDKDFHEKVDELGDGNSQVEKKINEKGQENDFNELKQSFQSMEMEVPKESDDDNKPMLPSNFEGDTLIQGQITVGRETEETETIISSSVDSTSSPSSSLERCEVEVVDDKGKGFPATGSTEELMGHSKEPELLVQNGAQEENGKDANIDAGENGFPTVGSLDSSEEVCEPFSQEMELIAKDQPPEEEKGEVASVCDEGIGFPLVGSLDSSQEVCESLKKRIDLSDQEPESLVNEKAAQEERCEDLSIGDAEIGFPLVGLLDSSEEVFESLEKLIDLTQEPVSLLKEKAAQEEKCEVTNVGNEGIGFPLVGLQDSSQEVSEPLQKPIDLTQEPEYCEVTNVGNKGIGFPVVGSQDSSQEVSEPLQKPIDLTQELESLVKEKVAEDEKCEVTNVGNERTDLPPVCSQDSSQEVCEEPVNIFMHPTQEPELLVNEEAAQEEKSKVTDVGEEGIGFPPVGSQDSCQQVCEPINKLTYLTQEPELLVNEDATQEEKHEVENVHDNGNAILPDGSLDDFSEVLEPQGKSIGLTQEGKLEDGNGFAMVVPLLSCQEVCDTQEKTIGLTQETELVVKESEAQEEKFGVGSIDKAENSFRMLGSIDSSQEVSEPREVTKPTELTVTNRNRNTGSTMVERKSPSFDFDLSLEARPSQDSDRTPLLCHDKAATRSQSSRGQQSYQYNKVPLEDEEVSVVEKTIMMERSYSEKSRAPFMSLLRKEEKGSIENQGNEEGNVGGYKKAEKEVMLSSSKGKRKPMSSFFASCICCDASIL